MLAKIRASRKLAEIIKDDYEETIQKIGKLREILVNLRYEGRHQLGKNLRGAHEVLAFFNGELADHVKEEEEVVFPYIRDHIPRLEPLVLLLSSEHEEFKRNLRSFQFWLGELEKRKGRLDYGKLVEKVRDAGSYLTYLLENHLQEESEILYRIADQELRPDEKGELYKKIRERMDKRRYSQ